MNKILKRLSLVTLIFVCFFGLVSCDKASEKNYKQIENGMTKSKVV